MYPIYMEKALSTLIYILYKSKNPLTDEECARLMNVSKRTIRNYVDLLNKDKEVILKKDNGYILTDTSMVYIPGTYKLDNSPMQRRKQELLKLLNDFTDIENDYLETFFISYSTLNTDIAYLKNKVAPYDVQIITRQNQLLLMGSEYEKRKILALMESFEDFNPDTNHKYTKIIQDILQIFTKESFSTNQFTQKYFINRLCIQLSRIEHGYRLQNNLFEHGHLEIYELAEKIKFVIESNLSIILPESEFIYIQELLITINLHNFDYETEDTENFFLEITQSIVFQINTQYDFDIDYDLFKTHFIQHIKNLYFRSLHHIEIDNPLSNISKNEYPLVHDIAVFTASIIEKYLNISINENEISFISFHLGAYLSKQTTYKINVAFVYQSYHPYYEYLLQNIIQYFNQELNLAYTGINRINLDSVLKTNYVDLVLSVDNTIKLPSFEVLHIPQVFDIHTKNIISQKIEEINNIKEKHHIQSLLVNLIKKDLFFTETKNFTKELYFKEVCTTLIKKDYIDKDFIEDLYLRESKSSTSFISGIAMPHTLSVHSRKSFISFFISEKDIQWDKDTNVRIIIMIGIANENKKDFRISFEALTKLLLNTKITSNLFLANTYESLIQILKSYLN